MLAGEGAFQATNTQLNFLPGAYAQISNAARQAWKKLPSSSIKTEDLSKVRQGPDKPYQDFVAWLLDAIRCQSATLDPREAADTKRGGCGFLGIHSRSTYDSIIRMG